MVNPIILISKKGGMYLSYQHFLVYLMKLWGNQKYMSIRKACIILVKATHTICRAFFGKILNLLIYEYSIPVMEYTVHSGFSSIQFSLEANNAFQLQLIRYYDVAKIVMSHYKRNESWSSKRLITINFQGWACLTM